MTVWNGKQYSAYTYSCYTSAPASHLPWLSRKSKNIDGYMIQLLNSIYRSFILTFTLQQYSIMSHKEILKFLLNIEESTPSSKHIRHILFILDSVLFTGISNKDMAVLIFSFSPCAVQIIAYCCGSNCFETSRCRGRN